MCGDLYCHSCGPAQGNCKCPNCGVWSMDGGCADPVACEAANKAACEAEFQAYQAMDNLEKHLKESHGMTVLMYAEADVNCPVCKELSSLL